MGYRIVYGPEIRPPRERAGTSGRLPAMTAAFLLIFALLVRQFWPEGTQILRQYLLPGELSVTEQAFSSLMQNIRGGESVLSAFTVFCQEIIQYGQMPY